MAKEYNVAIMGATGAVGKELLSIVEERKFPVKNLKLLASERSVGKEMDFQGRKLKVELLDSNSFKGVEIGRASCRVRV